MASQAELELDHFFTLSIDLLCIADFEGYFKRVNPAWERTLGYSSQELTERPFIDFVHPEDKEVTSREAQRLVDGGETISFENRYICKDGSIVWLLWNAAPQMDRRLIYAAARDQTRRKRREQQVRDIQNFLDSIVENLPITIFVKDARDLRFVLFNKAGQELLGHTNDQLIGKNDYDFFPKTEADFFTAKDRAVLESGQLMEIPEEPMATPHGHRILHTKKIPILDGAGKPAYLLGISEDITERKRDEETLRQQNALLTELAQAERTASEALKRAQSQMIQTEKLAAMGQLIAGVAHEINNPLAFVSNNFAVMQREYVFLTKLLELYQSADPTISSGDPHLKSRIAELADQIDLPYVLTNIPELLKRSREGMQRIQQIVSDLREFSRQDSSPEMQSGVDVNAGVQSALNILSGRAKRAGVEVRSELSPLPTITAQPTKISQVVLNLVANAIDACRAGCAVTVRTTPTEEGGVEIRVIDNGSGIRPEIIEKIFDPFFTTKPQGEGTGLGLSISHGIVAEHGGTIRVESEVGKGTIFIVRLPRGRLTSGDARIQ